MIQLIVGFVLGIISSLVASFLYTPLRQGLADILQSIRNQIDDDSIDLSDTWETQYSETSPEGNPRDVTEHIKLKHYGNTVTGIGTVTVGESRRFSYRLRLIHNMLVGSFKKQQDTRGAIDGSGVLCLKVSSNRKVMSGKCLWLDKDTGEIEVSSYTFKRLS